ncbi:hypothetical protein FGH87_26155 [Salmonella enterica]|nr:hypothetical protein [Salmonella enterica]
MAFIFIFSNVHAETCSQHDFDKADMAMDSLKSWKSVDDYFSMYSNCDVGYISEGTSEMIIRLLVDNWGQLNELSALVKRKLAIENYVLDHVNSTLGIDDLEKLRDYSALHCQIDNKKLCEKLHDSSIVALKKLYSL